MLDDICARRRRALVGAALALVLASACSDAELGGDTLQSGTPGVSLTAPARNTLYGCTGGSLQAVDNPWVTSTYVIELSERPVVPGQVFWDSEVAFIPENEVLLVSGNGLPSHATGTFPVPSDSAAYPYYAAVAVPGYASAADVPIKEQTINIAIPLEPEVAVTPSCLPQGPIGLMLTGAALFDATDAASEDAEALFPFDGCFGHAAPIPDGMYHYHSAAYGTSCWDIGGPDEHSPMVGFAFDGFGIYGPRDSGGDMISNDELDECHGHVGAVPAGNGEVTTYHYHLNREFPYSLGCYRGTPTPYVTP